MAADGFGSPDDRGNAGVMVGAFSARDVRLGYSQFLGQSPLR